MALYNVEQTCTLYNQCTSHWTDDNGSCWCFESCKANEKGKTFDLDGFVTMLQQEKYRCVDSDAKAIWNKAIKKVIFLIDKEYIEEYENCEVFLMFLTWPSFITIYIARIIIAIVEQFKGGGTDG